MTKTIENVSTYVPIPSKSQKFLETFAIAGSTAVIAIVLIGTATYEKRIDVVKEKMIYGMTLNANEAIIENQKIEQSKQVLNYYCSTNINDKNCTKINPLGIQQVDYKPDTVHIAKVEQKPNSPFSWHKQSAKKVLSKSKQTDKIKQIIAEAR